MNRSTSLAVFLCIAAAPASLSYAQAPATPATPGDAPFVRDVVPFLREHCNRCHGGERPKAKLSLEQYTTSSNIQQDYERWKRVAEVLTHREMPPDDQKQPSEQARLDVVRAIEAELARFDCDGPRRPGRVTIRRLNRAEYNNTIRDLVGVDFKPADDFPADDVGEGFDNIGDVLSIPPVLMEKYLDAAETIIEKAFADDTLRERIVVHTPGDGADDTAKLEATRKNLHAFASLAFRRPATADEIDRLTALMAHTRQQGYSEDESFRTALVAVLVSPHFLFRVERDPAADDEDNIRELNDYELASRLSYFLWSSMPDIELFGLAAQGKLRDPAVLKAQARRMLNDPKAGAMVDNFAGQWLELRKLAGVSPDRSRFPQFDDELRGAMRRETELLFETVMREDRSVLDFLVADFTFVNERLAKHYGIEGVSGGHFRRVDLPDRRRGVLTHGSVLLLTSNPTRTSPVKRGKWILDNMLDEPPSPPPPDAGELEEEAETLGTLRQRMEQHRHNESCAVCHRKMDALGFGLENFDVIGAWRDKDGRFEIDPAGELPGGLAFETPAELMDVLATEKKEDFARGLAKKMMIYALGRPLDVYDNCAVKAVTRHMTENDLRFSAVIEGIVTSEPFRLREGPPRPVSRQE